MKGHSFGPGRALLVALAVLFAGEAHARDITIVNSCSEQVCPGIYGTDPSRRLSIPANGGFCLAPGARQTVSVLDDWSNARIWGRRGCNSASGHCDTGDCGNRIACSGATGVPPTTLAEFNLRGHGDKDYYDISLVDGSDLTMSIRQTTASSSSDPFWCGNPICATDMNATCPAELQFKNGAGAVVGCMSYCTKYNSPEYCCTGAYNLPSTCPAYAYSRVVKAACPDAYSFAYDDQKSTYTCNGPLPDYTVTFCPNGGGGEVGGISTSAWYSVVNSKSGKCVDASWAGTANGTVILQYACTGNQNQQWQLVPAGGGYYNVVPRYATSLTWDVNGGAGATGNGVAVQLWGFPAGGSGANQQWMPVSLGSGLWKFVARHSGKCLDVPGASTADNVQMQQYDCNGTGAQAFSLVQK